jgi:predicted small secreted protein
MIKRYTAIILILALFAVMLSGCSWGVSKDIAEKQQLIREDLEEKYGIQFIVEKPERGAWTTPGSDVLNIERAYTSKFYHPETGAEYTAVLKYYKKHADKGKKTNSQGKPRLQDNYSPETTGNE